MLELSTMRKMIILAALLSVTGCQSNMPKGYAIDEKHDKSMEKLTSAVRDIQQQWNTSSRVSVLHTGNPPQHLKIEQLETSLKRIVSFPGGYDGKLDAFVKYIASVSGYDYLPPSGKKTIRPIPVIFREEHRSLGEYLYSAGVQAGKRALLVVDMKSKTLAITYTGY